MGFWRGLAGIVLPGAAIMSITLVAAIWTPLQGILLTAMALGFFIAAMMLMPKVNAASTNFWSRGGNLTATPASVPAQQAAGDGEQQDTPASSEVDQA
jgi:hypothetical protein